MFLFLTSVLVLLCLPWPCPFSFNSDLKCLRWRDWREGDSSLPREVLLTWSGLQQTSLRLLVLLLLPFKNIDTCFMGYSFLSWSPLFLGVTYLSAFLSIQLLASSLLSSLLEVLFLLILLTCLTGGSTYLFLYMRARISLSFCLNSYSLFAAFMSMECMISLPNSWLNSALPSLLLSFSLSVSMRLAGPSGKWRTVGWMSFCLSSSSCGEKVRD